MEPFFSSQDMQDALVSPFDDYSEIMEESPDILHVFGAPNDYEARTRYHGAESDLIHNLEFGNDIDDTILILPEQVQKAASDQSLQYLEDEGVQIQGPDRDLYTTADDWKSARDIASPGDLIHGHTSDYHGIKTHATGWFSLEDQGNYEVNTFGFPTERSERENILKHNIFAQTADTPRQIYKMIR